eukprot:7828723-Pyramimonas_sp.AAC.1
MGPRSVHLPGEERTDMSQQQLEEVEDGGNVSRGGSLPRGRRSRALNCTDSTDIGVSSLWPSWPSASSAPGPA